jgi:hypothetical protein
MARELDDVFARCAGNEAPAHLQPHLQEIPVNADTNPKAQTINPAPDPRKVKRSTHNGEPVDREFHSNTGEAYRVPVFYCQPGVSADQGAKELGGRIPDRSSRGLAEAERRIVAVIKDRANSPDSYPVILF